MDFNKHILMFTKGKGSSSDPCSSIYSGPSYFSEPETKAVERFLKTIQTELVAYLVVHTPRQVWMSPWAYTKNLTNDHDIQVTLSPFEVPRPYDLKHVNLLLELGSD